MFEQEINETIQRIARDVLQERTVLPLTEILEETRIPERFKAFFGTEAHWWIFTESVGRARDRRFDFAHPELNSIAGYLEQVQFKHARFERDDFLSVLDSAVKLTYNYLCRPQTTLKWYIFRGEPTKSIGETLLRMDAFVDYPYFRTVFSEWVDRKKEERPTFDSISAREFERIIRRIDDQILLSCTIDDLLGLMAPLYDFLGRGDAHSIPIEAMIVFFDDKNIRKLVDFLEKERAHRAHVSPTSFAMLMEELLNTSDDEPETDFSSVYQDDALDQVVREHLGAGLETAPKVEAPATARPTAGSMNGTVVMPTEVPGEESLTDEEDRWEEESGAYATSNVESDSAGAETGRSTENTETAANEEKPIGEIESAVPPVTGPEASTQEPVEEHASVLTTAHEREERGFFIDGDENSGDPILDLLIEPADEEFMVEESREEREKSEDEVAVEQVEEMRHPYDDETVEEVIAAIDEREVQTESRTESVDGENVGEEDVLKMGDTGHVVPEEDVFITDEVTTGDNDREEEAEEIVEEKVGAPEKTDDEFKLVDEPLRSESKAAGDEAGDGRTAARSDDVRSYIDAMLERKVVKKIFSRSRENYEETLDLLNSAGTWREASRILDELFIRYDVDPYSRIAIRFTDSVYGRYLSPVYSS